MRKSEWVQRYAEIGTWRRDFGPSAVPVTVVAASPEMKRICQLIEELGDGQPRFILVQAPTGGGKSTIVSAALAEFAERDIEYRRLTVGDSLSRAMEELGKARLDTLIIVDDCETITPPTLRKLLEKRANCCGLLLTAKKVSADLTTLLSDERDHYIVIPEIEQRSEDLLLIASVIWEDLGADGALAVACDESAVKALLDGPHASGAWSLHRVLSDVVQFRESGSDLVTGRPGSPVSYADIAPALLQMYKEHLPLAATGPTNAVMVVEGETDETYLLHAAKRAQERYGWRLLDGLTVQAAAAERAGGGTAVGRRLLQFQHEGTPALGLYDNDPAGRAAFETAKRNNLPRLLLPMEFDPLLRGGEEAAVEAEDLLPVELLVRYYEAHEEQSPEAWHWHLDHLRIAPRGGQKGDLADWVCEVASYDDLERFAYLLVLARRQLQLPCPTEIVDKKWFSRIRNRSTVSERVIINRERRSRETD